MLFRSTSLGGMTPSSLAFPEESIDAISDPGSSGGSETNDQASGESGRSTLSGKFQHANGRTTNAPHTGADTNRRNRLGSFLFLFRHC